MSRCMAVTCGCSGWENGAIRVLWKVPPWLWPCKHLQPLSSEQLEPVGYKHLQDQSHHSSDGRTFQRTEVGQFCLTCCHCHTARHCWRISTIFVHSGELQSTLKKADSPNLWFPGNRWTYLLCYSRPAAVNSFSVKGMARKDVGVNISIPVA